MFDDETQLLARPIFVRVCQKSRIILFLLKRNRYVFERTRDFSLLQASSRDGTRLTILQASGLARPIDISSVSTACMMPLDDIDEQCNKKIMRGTSENNISDRAGNNRYERYVCIIIPWYK